MAVNDSNVSSLTSLKSIANSDTTATIITVVHPGDRLVLNYQYPQTVARYTANDCSEFSNETHFGIYGNSYRFQSKEVNKNFTFVCQQENNIHNTTAIMSDDDDDENNNGCNDDGSYTNARTFVVRSVPPPRKRSWPIQNPNRVGVVDHGLIFLMVVGALGLISLAMNCCMDYSDSQKKKAADDIAREIMNDIDNNADDVER
ncbi:unnamed protein product [Cylindrotheca closterium]|uniref:Uncharacterized protein n=1 Tax=Cylindrotheca closterium TaxID=2856 RepID=A0AAD2CNR9_9STRA|nr:unnamed protein product [Cylindrotheca closterium]